MSNVVKRNLLDGIYLDFTFLHPVAPAHPDFRPRPDANATGDSPAPYPFPKTLGEDHQDMVCGVAAGLEWRPRTNRPRIPALLQSCVVGFPTKCQWNSAHAVSPLSCRDTSRAISFRSDEASP